MFGGLCFGYLLGLVMICLVIRGFVVALCFLKFWVMVYLCMRVFYRLRLLNFFGLGA